MQFPTGGNYKHVFGGGVGFPQAKLLDSLDKGCFYQFSFYGIPVSTDKTNDSTFESQWACGNRLGALFTKERIFGVDTDSIPGISPFLFGNRGYQPQVSIPSDTFFMDTTKFHRFEGTFEAEGGESYITMGNFYTMDQTLGKNFETGQIFTDTSSDVSKMWRTKWCIDSLNLHKVRPPDSLLVISSDTLLCPGDSIRLSASAARSQDSIVWDNGFSDSVRWVSEPGTYWVELQCGCDLSLRKEIEVYSEDSLPSLTLKDTVICAGESVNLDLPEGYNYQLNGQRINSNFTVQDSGNYQLEISSTCYSANYSFSIFFEEEGDTEAISLENISLCEGQDTSFSLPGNLSYRLNNLPLGDSIVSLNETGSYTLKAFSDCDSTNYYFEVNNDGCEPLIFVPDAFTPNNDGTNDLFKVSVLNYDRYEIRIFNRWGAEVFHSNDPENSWDGNFKGQAAPQGAYSLSLKVEYQGVKIHRMEQLSLIR